MWSNSNSFAAMGERPNDQEPRLFRALGPMLRR
jgi:hypothetical protein